MQMWRHKRRATSSPTAKLVPGRTHSDLGEANGTAAYRPPLLPHTHDEAGINPLAAGNKAGVAAGLTGAAAAAHGARASPRSDSFSSAQARPPSVAGSLLVVSGLANGLGCLVMGPNFKLGYGAEVIYIKPL